VMSVECVAWKHVTRHTSHVTRHTSHVTRHTSQTTPHLKMLPASTLPVWRRQIHTHPSALTHVPDQNVTISHRGTMMMLMPPHLTNVSCRAPKLRNFLSLFSRAKD
jgi:hypothetical protein